MRCPGCHHDSIYIEKEEKNSHIRCNNCELDLIIEDSFVINLLSFNYNLAKAKGLGKIAFLEGKRLEDNPYSDDTYDGSLSMEFWQRGWQSEMESMEGLGLSFAAKKEREEERDLEKEQIASLEKTLIIVEESLRIAKARMELFRNIIDKLLVSILNIEIKDYWFGGAYRKDLDSTIMHFKQKLIDGISQKDFPDK